MATEPITYFSDRAAAVSAALRMADARTDSTTAMERVDDKITTRLAEFDDRYAAPVITKFEAAADKWAKGSKGGFSELNTLLAAPTGSDPTTVPVRVKTAWGEKNGRTRSLQLHRHAIWQHSVPAH